LLRSGEGVQVAALVDKLSIEIARWSAPALSLDIFLGDCAMPDNPTANPRAFGESTDSPRPVSSLCREIGLAAVAIELDLELGALQPDVAEAIERGRAALFDAGCEASLIRGRRSVSAREKGGGQKVRRRPSKARPSQRFATGKEMESSARVDR
jgi:hypothetical protein